MTNNYLSNPLNPFFSLEDDVDDDTFLNGRNNHYPKSTEIRSTSNNYTSNSFEDKQQQLLEARKAIEESTIKSSERSITLLRDSEEIGITTAEELIRQREQLEQTENRLDDINATLRFSQKHIQSIKSVFGGLKNYLYGGNKSEQLPPSVTPSKVPNEVQQKPISEPSRKSSDVLSPSLQNTLNNFDRTSVSGKSTGQFQDMQPRSNVSAVLEKNLDEMSGSLARLKGLAMGLSSEIDSQNELIDSIMDKTEKADCMLQKQDKDIRKLLKK